MGELNLDNAVASDLTNVVKDFTVDSATTDAEGDWIDEKWYKYLGYYKDEKTPELTAVIDAKSTWTIGKGFKAHPEIEFLLNKIRGNGFDTFNTILENAMRTMLLGGNFYAEIIRDEDGQLLNLKPLDPGVMKHIINKQGIITGFEQLSKTKEASKKFPPEKIFYLQRNRIADETHGTGIAQKLKLIIDMKNEAMADQKTLMHRFVKPRWIFHLDTDVPSKILEFKTKADKANEDGENLYIPKDAVEAELMAVAPNATLNPMAWIQYLDNLFYQLAGVPKIIVGGSSEFTEKASSIVYLAFQQSVEEEQLFIEEQCGLQLGVSIELEFPVSIENELLSDKKKDQNSAEIQPNEVTAGAGQ